MKEPLLPPIEADWERLQSYGSQEVPEPCQGHDDTVIRELDMDIVYYRGRLDAEVAADHLNGACHVMSEYLSNEPDPGKCYHGRDIYKIGALELAFKYDHVELAEKVLRKIDRTSYLVFTVAAENKAKKCLDLMLRNGLDLNNPPNKCDVAIIGEMAYFLIDHGVSLNTQSIIYETPMSHIVLRGSPNWVQTLLDDPRGLVDHGRGELLFYAIDRRDSSSVDMLRVLLDHGYPINRSHYATSEISRQWFFYTGLGPPLHWAAIVNNLHAVRYLVERHADVTLRDDKGDTALTIAQRFEHTEIVAFLQEVDDTFQPEQHL